MLYRSQTTLLIVPALLTAALVFALAPACTMVACGPMMGFGGPLDHHSDDCQDYMMVDEPDGLPTPQPPAAAVFVASIPPMDTAVSEPVFLSVAVPRNPGFDPLGVRIRI